MPRLILPATIIPLFSVPLPHSPLHGFGRYGGFPLRGSDLSTRIFRTTFLLPNGCFTAMIFPLRVFPAVLFKAPRIFSQRISRCRFPREHFPLRSCLRCAPHYDSRRGSFAAQAHSTLQHGAPINHHRQCNSELQCSQQSAPVNTHSVLQANGFPSTQRHNAYIILRER